MIAATFFFRMDYETFCGGIFETNCYALKAPDGWMLFDAPDGACEWLVQQGIELRLLLLTHGHIDHIQDVARIQRRFGCPVGVTKPFLITWSLAERISP